MIINFGPQTNKGGMNGKQTNSKAPVLLTSLFCSTFWTIIRFGPPGNSKKKSKGSHSKKKKVKGVKNQLSISSPLMQAEKKATDENVPILQKTESLLKV